MKLPFWLRFAGFTDALLALSFLLKAICPLNVGCLTDPLVSLFFSPLFLIENKFGQGFSQIEEIVFLFWIWFVFGILIGLAIEAFKKD